MKNSVSGNVGYASIRDRWHLMKFSGLNVKIILIEDVYKIPRSGSSADHRLSVKESVALNYRSRAGVAYRKSSKIIKGRRPS